MKEAFETMGNHPRLTTGLCIVFIVALAIVCSTLVELVEIIKKKIK